MALAMRLFILDADDHIFRIAVARYNRMRSDPTSCMLPQFAAQRIRVATITVELRERQPLRVAHVTYEILPFAANGMLDRGVLRVHEEAHLRTVLPFQAVAPSGILSAEDSRDRILADAARWMPSPKLEIELQRAALGVTKVKSI
jgi:hypothetical protein